MDLIPSIIQGKIYFGVKTIQKFQREMQILALNLNMDYFELNEKITKISEQFGISLADILDGLIIFAPNFPGVEGSEIIELYKKMIQIKIVGGNI